MALHNLNIPSFPLHCAVVGLPPPQAGGLNWRPWKNQQGWGLDEPPHPAGGI